jgi:hypothetical protein
VLRTAGSTQYPTGRALLLPHGQGGTDSLSLTSEDVRMCLSQNGYGDSLKLIEFNIKNIFNFFL